MQLPEPRVMSIVGESVTVVTGTLTKAVNIPVGAEAVDVRITTTASDFFQFCPRLRSAFLFTAAAGWSADAVDSLTNRGDTTVFTVSDMAATTDFIYFGCKIPFRGVYLNIVAANGTASVLSAFYSNGSDWTGLTETDGTASAGATLAIDNTITWTVPTDWARTYVNGTGPYYWVRMNSTAGTDAATTIAEAIPLAVQPASNAAKGVVTLTTAAAPPRYWIEREETGGLEVIGANTDVFRLEWLITAPMLDRLVTQ